MLHLALLLAPLAFSASEEGPNVPRPVFAGESEASFFTRWASSEAVVPEAVDILLERVTTAVPWPRGMVFRDGELYVLARGRHRNAGGIDPTIEDHSGALFLVDPKLAEKVVRGEQAGDKVRGNGELIVSPKQNPFLLYDPSKGPPISDTLMDRPYCTLTYDEVSQNFFICGYSGVDLPRKQFRKNATDSIHRFDTRDGNWHTVELHDANAVPADELGYVSPGQYYPHHDPEVEPAPHGWLNGPDSAEVAGRYLYAAGKDNHVVVQYDLDEIRDDPAAAAPDSRVIFRERVPVRCGGEVLDAPALGASALAADGGYLYVGFRSSSSVIRFALDADGDVVRPLVGELIAVFEPWDQEAKRSANLIDLTFNSRGELFAATAENGRVWKVGVPNPERVFHGIDSGPHAGDGTPNKPFLDLRAETGNPRARVGNIAFDAQDRLYLCSGNYDTGTNIAGVIYRASELD